MRALRPPCCMGSLPCDRPSIRPRRCSCPCATQEKSSVVDASFFHVAFRIELFEIGPKVIDLLIVLDAGENHFGARNLGFGVFDVFLETGLVPDDAGILVGVGVAEVRNGPRFAPVEPVEFGPDLVGGAFAYRMANRALLE